MVIVSITTLRHNVDQTVVLQPGDHPFVRHASAVFFGDALIVNAERLNRWIESGIAIPQQACREGILKLLQDGILASEFTPKKVISFCLRCCARG